MSEPSESSPAAAKADRKFIAAQAGERHGAFERTEFGRQRTPRGPRFVAVILRAVGTPIRRWRRREAQ